MDLPVIRHFNLAVVGQERYSLTMQPRPSINRLQDHVIPQPHAWIGQYARSASLHFIPRPRLEVYSDYRDVCPDPLPCITLLYLNTLRIGHLRADVLCRVVDCLILPDPHSARLWSLSGTHDSTPLLGYPLQVRGRAG